ncbi:RteC protein [compost metagenome]
MVRKYLRLLKELIQQHSLASPEEEINFLKYTKPRFYCWLIYYVERYSIYNSRPLESIKSLVCHYADQLRYLHHFFRQNEFYYQYYKMAAVEMDYLYFIRRAEVPSILIPEVPEVDPSFGTAMDYLFTKFRAYEKLQAYIQEEISRLGRHAENHVVENATTGISMKWTGDKTNLVEVIYGLYYTGQLNSGNATVADIIKWMEQHLQIDLSRSYKNFIDIKNRKRDSPTKFLDKMKAFILQRIDEDNTYKPNRGIRFMEDRGNK